VSGLEPQITLPTLRLIVAMLDQPIGAWYGLELAKAATLKTGTIYPLLARLERAGWLESEWEHVDPSVVGRPRRRLYRLTPHGARAAADATNEHLSLLEGAARRQTRSPELSPRGATP